MLVLDTSSPFGCSLLNKLLLVYEVPRGSITAWIEHNSVKSRNVLSNEAANLYVGSKKRDTRAEPGREQAAKSQERSGASIQHCPGNSQASSPPLTSLVLQRCGIRGARKARGTQFFGDIWVLDKTCHDGNDSALSWQRLNPNCGTGETQENPACLWDSPG